MRSKLLCSARYVQFDNPIADNSPKDRRHHVELEEFVPITAKTRRFPLKKGKITAITERKQFLRILDYASTVYKSQGSIVAHMKGDLNRSTGEKSAMVTNYQQPISQGQFYTLLSNARRLDKVILLNFEPEDIMVNESALEEMV